MQYIDLNTLTPNKIINTEPLYVSIKNHIDTEKLRLVDKKAEEGNEVFVLIFLSKSVTMSILTKLTNVRHISLLPTYDNSLQNLNELTNFDLKSLRLGQSTKKTISFKSISSKKLEFLEFLEGLGNKSQHDFVNLQTNLQKLHLKSLDLSLIKKNEKLTELYIHSSLKSETLLGEKFPHLRKLSLFALSKLTTHSFITNLENLENVNISYNSHLVSFPKLKNPEKIKSIEMYTCPNFNDVESLLRYENLEQLVLTSHDKPLKINVENFAKLKQLPKLKTLYSVWGKKPKAELDKIENLYTETGWINSALNL
ncbi:hypothetical protein ACILE9_00770 [Capnocytophaga cynodegmi]|uniref:hypothetical protein n=1 Tax=Capnocytophaga cynodegmi TaxID=28189 RepID=UPI0037CDE55A